LLKFINLLEAISLTKRTFAAVETLLAARGLLLREDTVLEAAIIEVPCSTKGKDGQCDLELHQTKMDNHRHFGGLAHIDAVAYSERRLTLVTTAANVSDITQIDAGLNGDETMALDQAGYRRVKKRQENGSISVTCHVALPPVSGVRRPTQKQENCAGRSNISRPVFARRLSDRRMSALIILDTSGSAFANWTRA